MPGRSEVSVSCMKLRSRPSYHGQGVFSRVFPTIVFIDFWTTNNRTLNWRKICNNISVNLFMLPDDHWHWSMTEWLLLRRSNPSSIFFHYGTVKIPVKSFRWEAQTIRANIGRRRGSSCHNIGYVACLDLPATAEHLNVVHPCPIIRLKMKLSNRWMSTMFNTTQHLSTDYDENKVQFVTFRESQVYSKTHKKIFPQECSGASWKNHYKRIMRTIRKEFSTL